MTVWHWQPVRCKRGLSPFSESAEKKGTVPFGSRDKLNQLELFFGDASDAVGASLRPAAA